MPLDEGPRFDKSNLPSRHVTEGPSRAPHRSFYYAMGMTEEEIHSPLIGVATCWNEAAPCNITLSRQAQAVKAGVKAANGTPREFTTITVTDGIAMGHQGMKASLVSREIIADSVELTMRGHCYDALVGLAGCDKSLPGMMMAQVRLNVPSIFLYGGAILPGNFRGQNVTIQNVFEGVGKHASGEFSDADLKELEECACPSGGACGGQFTANTMATVAEAIGLALPHSCSAPAPYLSRDAYCEDAGRQVMNLIELGLRPRDIVTRKALENAARVVAASGGSTNAGLHLPAIAHEAGIDFDLLEVTEIFRKTPYICDLQPGGQYVAKDMYDIGGIPVLLKELLDNGLLHGDCITVTGKTMAENLADLEFPTDQKVVYPVKTPLSDTGGVVGLQGSLAPDGAIVKVAGMEVLKFEGPARCFDREEEAFDAVIDGRIQAGDVIVIRYEGPQGRAGHARDAGDDLRHLRARTRRHGRAGHGRAVLRRDARLLHRACRAGGGRGRTHRAAARRRHHPHRRRCRDARRGPLGGRDGGAREGAASRPRPSSARARSGNTPRPSAPRATAPSPIRAAAVRSRNTLTSDGIQGRAARSGLSAPLPRLIAVLPSVTVLSGETLIDSQVVHFADRPAIRLRQDAGR